MNSSIKSPIACELYFLLESGEIATYQFKPDEYIRIDLNTSRDYFVPANPDKGFNFPYYISFKAGNSLAGYKNTVMFDTNNNLLTLTNEQMISSIDLYAYSGSV